MIVAASAILLLAVETSGETPKNLADLEAAHDCLVEQVSDLMPNRHRVPSAEMRNEIALTAARACQDLIEAYAAGTGPGIEREWAGSHQTYQASDWFFVTARHYALRLVDAHLADADSETEQ